MARGFKGFRRNPDRVIVSISVTKTKTTYNIGDALTTSDIRVIATYSDRLTRDVTSKCVINTSAVNMFVNGNYNIVVAYTEGVKTVSTNVGITINACSYITAAKAKTTYDEGDTLATNDINVIAVYPDGAQKNVTSLSTFNTSNVKMGTPGTYQLVVAYSNGTKPVQTSIAITVNTLTISLPASAYWQNGTPNSGTVETTTGDNTKVFSKRSVLLSIPKRNYLRFTATLTGRYSYSGSSSLSINLYNSSGKVVKNLYTVADNEKTSLAISQVFNISAYTNSGLVIGYDLTVKNDSDSQTSESSLTVSQIQAYR